MLRQHMSDLEDTNSRLYAYLHHQNSSELTVPANIDRKLTKYTNLTMKDTRRLANKVNSMTLHTGLLHHCKSTQFGIVTSDDKI